MSNEIESVRVIQMSNQDSDVLGKAAAEVQDDYFLDTFLRQDAVYPHKANGIIAEPGTPVLFQFESRIVASATFTGREVYEQPRLIKGVEYRGELHFEPGSVRVFDPFTPEAMRKIWPEFDHDERRSSRLAASGYSLFLETRRNVRPGTVLGPDEADSDDGYESNDADERPSIPTNIKRRRGSEKFRKSLMTRYNATRLVTGCKVRDLLEAAHIHPHRGTKDDHPENGLLLRADIHTMFDVYLLAIEPNDLTIELHPRLAQDDHYGQFQGKRLNCKDDVRPSEAELKVRFQKFQSDKIKQNW